MSLDGHYYSFRTGSETERGPQCVDRFEARVAGNRVTFYRNGRVGCMAPVQSASARPMESFEIRGQELHGPVRGTLSADGAILWSHGYTSRKEVMYLPENAHLPNPNRKKDHVTPSGPGPSPHSVKTAAATYKGLKGAATVATVASGGCSIQ